MTQNKTSDGLTQPLSRHGQHLPTRVWRRAARTHTKQDQPMPLYECEEHIKIPCVGSKFSLASWTNLGGHRQSIRSTTRARPGQGTRLFHFTTRPYEHAGELLQQQEVVSSSERKHRHHLDHQRRTRRERERDRARQRPTWPVVGETRTTGGRVCLRENPPFGQRTCPTRPVCTFATKVRCSRAICTPQSHSEGRSNTTHRRRTQSRVRRRSQTLFSLSCSSLAQLLFWLS